MTPEIILLAFSAAAIAFVHTILGPDHYLPFVTMAKARQWSMSKTLRITLICGMGHLAGSVTPWLIFIIFILGPCEPLIPLLMFPAAQQSLFGVLIVTGVFGVVTVFTMTLAVTLAALGLKAVNLGRFERYNHAVAGSAVLVCGLSVAILGI